MPIQLIINSELPHVLFKTNLQASGEIASEHWFLSEYH